MALNKLQLKIALRDGLTQIFNSPQINNNVETVANQMATLISNEVDIYVKQGQVQGTTSDGATIVQSNII